jgi:FlaG/FlaF family flagellin (archaellin)
VALNVEGRKHRGLREDCQAVSEVVGQVLMIAIVVLAFSSIAIFIFSDIVVNPPHTPHTDLSEKININDDTVTILHSGGEAIDLKAIKIVLSVNGIQNEFNMPDPSIPDPRVEIRHLDGSLSNDSALMLGDYIVIHTNPEDTNPEDTNPEADKNQKRIDMNSTDIIDMYFVYTPSQQVIQKVTLQNGK